MAFTFDELVQKSEEKFKSFEVELDGNVVRFENIIRLPKDTRDKLMSAEKELGKLLEEHKDDEAFDSLDVQIENLRERLRLLSMDTKGVNALLKKVGNNAALLMEIYDAYWEETEAGEAPGSPEK